MKKWVYSFGAGRAEGHEEMRELLGGNPDTIRFC